MGGARVGLKENAANTTTDAEGAYGFHGLEPGAYTVSVQRLGYKGQARKAIAVAGEVAALDFALVPLPAVEPHYRTFVQEGMIGCGAALPAGVTTTACYGDPASEDPILEFNVTGAARHLLTEIVWDSSSATTGRELLVDCNVAYDEGPMQDCGDPRGPSPLIHALALKTFSDTARITDYVFVNFFSASNPSPVAYQQRFTAYFTLFYDMGIPDGFTALPPGEAEP